MVELVAAADTYITENPGLGGTTSVHGSDETLWMARGQGGVLEIPLVRFDLSALAGSTVTGSTAQLTLRLVTAWNGTPGITQTVSLRESLVGWDEASTSFNNFGGSGFDEAAHTGPELSSRSVTFGGAPPEPVVFDLPVSVVQDWIDDPASNHGLILISQTAVNQTDMVFASRERDGGTLAPVLSFDVTPVPLPPAAGLLGLALLALFSVARREAGGRGMNAPARTLLLAACLWLPMPALHAAPDLETNFIATEANSDGTTSSGAPSGHATITDNAADTSGEKLLDGFVTVYDVIAIGLGAPLDALNIDYLTDGNPDPWLSFQLQLDSQHTSPLRFDSSIRMRTDPIGLAALGGTIYHRAILDVRVTDLNGDGEAWFRFPSWDVRARYFDIDFSTGAVIDVKVPLPGNAASGLPEVTPADGIVRLVDAAGPFDLGGPLNAGGADEAEDLFFLLGGSMSTGDRVEIAGYTCIAASAGDCGDFQAISSVPLPGAAWMLVPALALLFGWRSGS